MIIYTRTDFAQVGTTNRGCMAVVSGEKKKNVLDKISVGSQNGSLITLTRKMNDTVIDKKTPPGPPIDAMCLAGQLGTTKDKLFVASGNSVRGINKKGKMFYDFPTDMAEPARRLHVYGVELVVAGRRSLHHYHDGVDMDHFLSPEDIHDVVSLINEEAWGDRKFAMIIGCADATIKCIEGSDLAYDIKLSDIPFTLALFMGDGGYSKQLVLYGTRHGKLGLVSVPKGGGKVLWEVETTSQAAITSIMCYAMTGSQFPDILIGKEDGCVEVYTVDESDHPTIFGMFQCDESITSISCGFVSSWNEPDIVVCTYTGWLFTLSKSNRAKLEQVPQSANFSVKVQQLRSEVEELESKVMEERQRYEEMTKKVGNGPGVAFIPQFQIHDSFEFIAELGCYNLTIELVLPIDFIMVQSEIPLKLIEVEKNASVVSEVRQSDLNPWPLLASYRCQANICRLELRVRSNEGEQGVLSVYVSPKVHPKVAQIAGYIIRPLSSHIRTHDFDLSRPLTTLSFTGTFSISEAHAWLHQLIPNIPLKCPPSDSITNNFQCVTNGGTLLQVIYSKGSAIFRSDCLTTISIIRDRVTEETMSKQVRVDVSCDLNEESVFHCLKLLDPKMTHLINLEKQKILASALKELEANNSDVFSFLSSGNAELLRNYDRIHEEAENMKIDDTGIIQIYRNLLTCRAKLNGKPIRGKLEGLEEILRDNYSLENVVEYFRKAND